MDDRHELLYIGGGWRKPGRHKCPRSVDFRAELPRHPTGKLLKRVLRDKYAAAFARNEQEFSR